MEHDAQGTRQVGDRGAVTPKKLFDPGPPVSGRSKGSSTSSPRQERRGNNTSRDRDHNRDRDRERSRDRNRDRGGRRDRERDATPKQGFTLQKRPEQPQTPQTPQLLRSNEDSVTQNLRLQVKKPTTTATSTTTTSSTTNVFTPVAPPTATKTTPIIKTKSATPQIKVPAGTKREGGASCFKLLDEKLQFNESLRALLSETPAKDFLVVGILGQTGVGKSAIMSMLHGAQPGVFKTQTLDDSTDATFCSSGVDMAVSNERMILLDSQPVQSAAVLDKFIRTDVDMPRQCTSYEQAVELQSYQLAIFMYSVCDVVLIAHDWAVDFTFFQFLWTSEQLQPVAVQGHQESNPRDVSISSSTTSTSSTPAIAANTNTNMNKNMNTSTNTTNTTTTTSMNGTHNNLAQMLFVFNLTEGTSSAVEHHQAIVNFFRHSKMVEWDQADVVQVDESRGPSHRAHERSGTTTQQDQRVVFEYPQEGKIGTTSQWDSEAALNLRNKILNSPRRCALRGSERDWWHNARQIWSNIEANDVTTEYIKYLFNQNQ